MTYISEQNSRELRAHIRSLQKTPGWRDAVTDRLFKEIVEQDAALKRLRATLQDIADMNDEEPRQPDDADWRFRALECKRAAALALSSTQSGSAAK